VVENRGRVALQRGPIIYCVEGHDNPDGHVLNLQLDDKEVVDVEHDPALLGGVTVLKGKAMAWREGRYASAAVGKRVNFTAIPYSAWANRGKSEMTVWLARDRTAIRPVPAPTIASEAKLTTSGGTNPAAVTDRIEAKSSIDHDHLFFHWWPKKGTNEWVQLEFAAPATVSEVEVYWFDDTGRGECRLPASWTLLFREGAEWKPVTGADEFGTAADRYNVTRFAPVTTDALRIEVQLQEGWSAGIHEWRVKK